MNKEKLKNLKNTARLVYTTDCNQVKIELGEDKNYTIKYKNKEIFKCVTNKISAIYFAEGFSLCLEMEDEMQQDINSILSMLEGTVERIRIINFIKKYLVKK